MKCYILSTQEGLIALNSAISLGTGEALREFTEAEYKAVSEWDRDISEVGNKDTLVSGQDIKDATVSFRERSEQEKGEELKVKQERSLDVIDGIAEDMRGQFITLGGGQIMVYQAKLDEAKKFQTRVSSEETVYPHLEAEAAATNADISDVAALIVSADQAWLKVSAKIEGVRRGAKVAIRAAQTVAEIDQILADVIWPVSSEEVTDV